MVSVVSQIRHILKCFRTLAFPDPHTLIPTAACQKRAIVRVRDALAFAFVAFKGAYALPFAGGPSYICAFFPEAIIIIIMSTFEDRNGRVKRRGRK
jgi:hypothetical protein